MEGNRIITVTNVLIFVIMTLVLVQAAAIIVGGSWGQQVKLGPIFIILAVGFSAAFSVAIFRKMSNEGELTQKDIFAIIITIGITLLLMFFLRGVVPEIFQESVVELQSIIGI